MNKLLIVLISVFMTYLNYKVYKSYVVQTKVVVDFNTQKFSKENFIILKNTDINFPNLSGTAFPMYALLANYYLKYGEVDNVLKTVNSFENINPYLRVKESIKAEVFYKLGLRDSSYHYAKIAYENLPLNARHFQQYLTELTWRKDLDEINNVFLSSEAKYNHEYWLFYFSAVINLKDDKDVTIDSLAKVALHKFPKNDRIKTITGYILYGIDNIKKSYQLNQEAALSFKNSDFKTAATKFIEAGDLNPIDYTFKENAGMSLIKLKEYKKAIVYLNQSLESGDKLDDGKSEFGLGLCYKELGEKLESCHYLNIAMEKNYKPAFSLAADTCIKNID